MLPKIVLALLLLKSIDGFSQNLPPFKPLRYNEDYAVLANDSSNWYNNIKYSPLNKNGSTYISFGGDLRYQYFFVKNEGWGQEPADKDGYVFTRWLAHADLHAGKYFRAFFQLQSSFAGGKTDISPVDQNPLEIHQAFVDINAVTRAKSRLVFRVGRQELSYGSQRIISTREGPNNRQSFDGIKSIFTAGKTQADFFYVHYVAAQKGIFDDGFNKGSRLWGAYIVQNNLLPSINVDLYYLGLWKEKAVFDAGAGKELRHSFGTRMWGSKNGLSYDAEGLYQFGKWNGKNISAWTASMNTAYKLKHLKLAPEFGLKAELISGNKTYGGNTLGTFNPLFPRGAYFGLIALIGPANLQDVHPSLTLSMTKNLFLGFDYDAFWRYSVNDGLYAVSGILLYSGKNNTAKYVGQQLSSNLVFTPNKFFYLRGEFTWFKTGEFLQKAGPGKDIVFFGITTQVTL